MHHIYTILETYKSSIFEKDVDRFCSLFDEDVRIFDMWQQWSYDGLPAWREMANGWFSSLGTDRDVVTFDDLQISGENDLAFATAIVRFAAVSAEGKELRHLEERFTWVAQKKGEGWKIVHQHTSTPIDFNSMKAMLTR